MLGLDRKSLLFPKLVYLNNVDLVREAQPAYASNPPVELTKNQKLKMIPRRVETLRLYKLEWHRMEEKKQERSHAAYASMPKMNDEPFHHPPSLPMSYKARMDPLEFAIPDSYMKAINHCCRQAMLEWEHPYPFDTCIREHCLIASKAFIESAMHLLADCIYDPEAKYYNRDWETKVVFEQTALLRFWRYQMGTWAAFDAAGLKITFSHAGGEPVITNTMYHHPPSLSADSRIRIMESDMFDFHNSLMKDYRCTPIAVEPVKPHKKAKK